MTAWDVWWSFNREPFLRRDSAARGPVSGSRADDTTEDSLAGSMSKSIVKREVGPALLEALDQATSADETNALLMALARIGEWDEDERGVSPLQRRISTYLSHNVRLVRENACLSLGVLGNRDAVPQLASIARADARSTELCGREPSTRMRAFAAYALGISGARGGNADVRRYATSQLMGLLKSKDVARELQVACTIALGVIPADELRNSMALPGAVIAAGSSDEIVRSLLQLLNDRRTDRWVRAHAATSLASQLATASEVVRRAGHEALLDALESRKSSNELQRSAALALGKIGDADEDELDARTRAALMDAVGTADKLTGFYARVSLGRIGARLGNAGEAAQGTDEIKSFLIKRLARDKSVARPWTALAIGVLGHGLSEAGIPLNGDATMALRIMLKKQGEPGLASACGLGASLTSDDKALEPLLERLGDVRDTGARGNLVLALGLLGNEEAADPIVALLPAGKHDPDLLERSAEALRLMGHEDRVADLLQLSEDCECLTSKVAVARALGRTQDARAVEPLLEMLRDGDSPAILRAWVATSLGWLAARHDMPWASALSIDLNYSANPESLTDASGAGVIDFH